MPVSYNGPSQHGHEQESGVHFSKQLLETGPTEATTGLAVVPPWYVRDALSGSEVPDGQRMQIKTHVQSAVCRLSESCPAAVTHPHPSRLLALSTAIACPLAPTP